jgi:hypothetical protein
MSGGQGGRTERRPAHAPSNNAFKLTRSIGLRRMEALRATMRRPLRPSQLNAMFSGPHCSQMERR